MPRGVRGSALSFGATSCLPLDRRLRVFLRPFTGRLVSGAPVPSGLEVGWDVGFGR